MAGAFGTFVYAHSGAIDVPVVSMLLVGSVLGARIGTDATRLVDEADIKGYFAGLLLAGCIATASAQVGAAYGVVMLETASTVLIIGTTVLVSGVIVRALINAHRKNRVCGSPVIQ